MHYWIVLLAVLAMISCGDSQNKNSSGDKPDQEKPIEWPKDWSKYLGKKVTVEGTALDAKLGAVLNGNGPDIWIDGLDAWPNGYYQGGRNGKRVRVTGVVIERDDLPVIPNAENDPKKGGVPVAPGQDPQKAKKRFLLKDAKWQLID